jgi:hypothetical protein
MTMANAGWTEGDDEVIRELGFAQGSGEARLVRGQRRINGRLFDAVNTLLRCIPRQDLSPEDLKALDDAITSIAKIPGEDPPRCEQPEPPKPPGQSNGG